MKRSQLKRKIPLKRVAFLARKMPPKRQGYSQTPHKITFLSTTKTKKRLKAISVKTLERNGKWRLIVIDRAQYLINKYGFLICEYSGEHIKNLTSVADDPDDGWGHHIDGNRNNCTPQNAYIIKFRYHSYITDHNIRVKQEGFEGRQDET